MAGDGDLATTTVLDAQWGGGCGSLHSLGDCTRCLRPAPDSTSFVGAVLSKLAGSLLSNVFLGSPVTGPNRFVYVE